MEIDIGLLVGAFGTIFGVYMGLRNFKRLDHKDVEDSASQQALFGFKLEQIQLSLDKIEKNVTIDMEKLEKDIKDNSKRLFVVERDIEKAHARIDSCTGCSTTRDKLR